MGLSKFKRFCAIAAAACFASTLNIELPTNSSGLQLSFDTVAQAGRSGGRAGGGSFRSSPSRSSPSRSSGSSNSPSSNSSNSNRSTKTNNSPSYNNRPSYNNGPVIVPVPVPVGPQTNPNSYNNGSYNNGRSTNPSTASSSENFWIGLIALLIVAGISIGIIVFIVMMVRRGSGAGMTKQEREIANDKVTITKVQVALLAQARDIQAELTQLSLELSSDQEWGLVQLLQESALALLRTPENWSHALVSSETVNSREAAETNFSKISIAERSKFTVETLTNVGGRVSKRQDFSPDPDKGPGSYIVVTLLVGTAHDNPLFSQVHDVESLKEVLEKLAAVPSEYLMVFELIWTPQDASDNLTYDELLAEYPDMVQL